jgi:transposase
MRFVPIKTREQQAALMVHRTRQLLARQRTMLSNAIRGQLAEHELATAKGRKGIGELLAIIANTAVDCVPLIARASLDALARQHSAIVGGIKVLDKHILAWHRSCEASQRLEVIPGAGPIVATALVPEVGD